MPGESHATAVATEPARVVALALNTPYAELVPAMSDDDRSALETDLRCHGQQHPVLIDEHRNILDGHNRAAILGSSVTTQVVEGLSEAEKKAFVVTRSLARRNMTGEQKRAVRESMKRIAFELRQEDARLNTQERIAEVLGVGRQRVSEWLAEYDNNGNAGTGNTVAKPDARFKHAPEVRVKALERVASGETRTAVAADLGVPPTTVSMWLKSTKQVHAVNDAPTVAEEQGSGAGDESPKPTHPTKSRSTVDHEARERDVLALHEQGLGTGQIAARLQLDRSAVSSAKAALGISEKSPPVKLWTDVDRVTTSLAGVAIKIEELAPQVESNPLAADEKEIRACVKSLSESSRTVRALLRALKRRCP